MKEFWDQRYSETKYAYGKTPNDFLAANFQQLPLGKVLCLAEGEGRNSVFLASKGYQVTAVDNSVEGLKKTQKLAAEFDVEVETIEADLNDFDMATDRYDGIVSISAHLPAELRKKVHQQVVKALKPGGVLLLEAYHPDHINMPGVGGPPAEQIAMFMTLKALEQELIGLEVLFAKETQREFNEGQYHQGLSAVTQLIAQKPLTE